MANQAALKPPAEDVEELLALAYRDDLTGLYNRRYFTRVVAESLGRENGERPYSFLLLDVDFFKEINDTYGHGAGDDVLKTVAGILTESTKGEETVIRYAGDEFILYLPGADQAAGLERAEQILVKARETVLPLSGGAEPVRLSFSIGVASFPEDGSTWEEIIEKADQSLYAAKQLGRDRASPPPAEGSEIRRGDDLSRIFPCPRLVGREEPLERIRVEVEKWMGRAWEAGPSPFLLCRGDPGSGKSRLLKELAAWLAETGCVAIDIRASEQLQALPYGAFIQALLSHAGSAEALWSRIEHDLGPGEEDLWRKFFGEAAAGQEAASEQEATELFVRILRSLGRRPPLVLLLDDADLLDACSGAVLKALRETVEGPFPFVLLTLTRESHAQLRGEGGKEGGSKIEKLKRLLEGPLPRITLEPLNEEGVETLVQTVFPTLRADPTFFTELLLRSRGNPAYVEEALKFLVQTGRLAYRRSAWQWDGEGLEELPDTLPSLLEERFRRLDPEVQVLLEKASLMGDEVDPELVRKLDASNEGHLWDLLDKARRFGILRSRSRWGDTGLRFASRTARRVSYEQVPEQDRISWHIQMARFFETLHRKPDLLHLGPMLYHSEMAGLQAEIQAIREKFRLVDPSRRATVISVPTGRRARAGPPEHSPIPADGWKTIFSLFHLLRAALQNLRLYPETSRTVTSACERLLEGLQKAFALSEVIHFSEAEGVILVNGDPPPWKGEEKIATEGFHRILARASLKGIAFQNGVDLGELKAFLGTWHAVLSDPRDPTSAWNAFEERDEIRHIFLNTKVYVALSDSDLYAEGPVQVVTDSEPGPLADLSTLIASVEEKILSLQGTGGEVDPPPVGPDAMAEFASLLERLRGLLPALEEGAGETALRVPPEPEGERPPEGRQAPVLLDPEPASEEDVRCLLADVLSGEPRREARGFQKIAQMGEQAVEPLYFVLTQTEDTHEGRVAARLLKSLAPDFAERLSRDLEGLTDPAARLRLLRHAVPVLEPAEAEVALVRSLQEADEAIAREALHQLETRFSQNAASLLLEALPLCPAQVRVDVCLCLGRLGDARSIQPLLDYLGEGKVPRERGEERFLEGVCHALGYFDDPRVIDRLGRLLSAKGWFPWSQKAAHPGLRKAAVRALERIGTAQASEVLKRHEDDKDPWIRFRVRNFLTGKGGRTIQGRSTRAA